VFLNKESRMNRLILALGITLLAAFSVAADRSAAPAGAEVYFIAPHDGAKVHSPFTVSFGLKGMGIAPAGIKFDNTGHHHLLVDMDVPADLSVPMPATATLLHFGKGQTQTSLALPPGKHTLQLVFADLNHVAFNPPLISKKVTITVVN
jgi:Domain of unknown function (DUF4399)